jgi:phosphoglucosamine mutase
MTTGCEPDGLNINAAGGATRPGTIQQLTQAQRAHIGVAFDGDADRAVFSDAQGRLINGDRTMALWCAHWRQHGALEPPVVVGTVMSNDGFEQYLAARGIRLERTPVGDKHVSARVAALGARLGGEQSGHIIFSHHGPTGDGLITALEVLRVLRREGRCAAELYGAFENLPQLLVNVRLPARAAWEQNEKVAAARKEAETALAGHGRLSLRASGTQPMLRVMVEADDADLCDRVAQQIVGALESALGATVHSRVDLTNALGE